MSESFYNPEQDYRTHHPDPVLREEKREFGLVNFAARDELTAASLNFLSILEQNESLRRFILSQKEWSDLPGALKAFTERDKEKPEIPRAMDERFYPQADQAIPYMTPILSLAAEIGSAQESPDNTDLKQQFLAALKDSGLLPAMEKVRQGYCRVNSGWDVNALLEACATFKTLTSAQEVNDACRTLTNKTFSKNRELFSTEALMNMPRRTPDGTMVDRQLKPPSIFNDAELFSHVGRGCNRYEALPAVIDKGLKAAYEISDIGNGGSFADRSQSFSLWYNLSRIRDLATALQNTDTRRKIENLSAGDDGAAMRHVLSAYDTARIGEAARQFEAGHTSSIAK